MYLDEFLLDDLQEAARQNPRKRMNLDLRNSSEDGSQRMLNAAQLVKRWFCCAVVWMRYSTMMRKEKRLVFV